MLSDVMWCNIQFPRLYLLCWLVVVPVPVSQSPMQGGSWDARGGLTVTSSPAWYLEVNIALGALNVSILRQSSPLSYNVVWRVTLSRGYSIQFHTIYCRLQLNRYFIKTIFKRHGWTICDIIQSGNIRQLHDGSVFCTLIAKYHHAMVGWLVRSVTCEYFCKKQRKDNLNCTGAIHTLLDIGYILIMITFLTSSQAAPALRSDIDWLSVPDKVVRNAAIIHWYWHLIHMEIFVRSNPSNTFPHLLGHRCTFLCWRSPSFCLTIL